MGMTDALPYAIALAIGAAPLIAIRFVSFQYMNAARDVWLWGLAWIAAGLTFSVSVPLGLIAVAVLLHWRSWSEFPAVATWAGIIATWAIVQALPPAALDVLQIGWRVGTAGLIAFGAVQRWHKHEVKATTGSRILLAALIVLVWPFTSPWEWPVYALGLWLTSSWVALAAMLVAVAVKYPVTAPWVAGLALVTVAMFRSRRLTVLVLDRTPRGGSLDGLRTRWRTWGAMVRLTARWPVWLWGWGPIPASRLGPSLEQALRVEAVLLSERDGVDRELATSPTHCEPLELACTYGVLGAAAVVLLGWQLATRTVWGDPWSAAAWAGVMLSCASIPARAAPVGVVWLVTLAVVAGRP